MVCRHQLSGALEVLSADAVLLATGGYSNVFYLSTNALKSNATAIWQAHRRGACFANPCFTQIHPTCIPSGDAHQSKLTLMSESLRNDGRIWLPLRPGDDRPPAAIPEAERDYFLERQYPSYGNLVPRDLASRRARELCLEGRGLAPGAAPSISTWPKPSPGMAQRRSRRATETCWRCTSESPARTPEPPRCGSIPPPITRWAGCGSTTT